MFTRLFIAFAIVCIAAAPCDAQPPQAALRRIHPLGDHQLGKTLLFEGRTEAASHAFETAFRQSRSVGDRHGIDAVPVLCRNAQSLYLAGNLPAALSNANAALTLAEQSRYWVEWIEPLPTALRAVEMSDGAIAWVAEGRISRLADYPNAWPVAIGSELVFAESTPSDKQPSLRYEPILVDAVEVYLAQAVALRLRNHLLGPLAQHDPLSHRVEEAYTLQPPNVPELLLRCQNVCRAISLRALGDDRRCESLLLENLTLDDGFDHPLTASALLELASLAADRGDYAAAAERAGQASLLAARLRQIDVLAESTTLLVRCSDAVSAGSGLRIAEDILRWSAGRWGLAEITLHTLALESASGVRDAASVAGHAQRFRRGLGDREISLPHLAVAEALVQTRMQLAAGDQVSARRSWERMLKLAGGAESPSHLFPRWLQFEQIRSMRRGNQVGIPQLTQRAEELLARPVASRWVIEPWRSIAWDNLPLDEICRWLLEDYVRSENLAATVRLIDLCQQRQLRAQAPLTARLYEARTALDTDPAAASAALQEPLRRYQTRHFTARIRSQEMQTLWRSLQNLAADGGGWSAAEHRQWEQLKEAADLHARELAWIASLSADIPRRPAPAVNLEAARQQLGEGDAVLSYLQLPGVWVGCYVDGEGGDIWTAPDDRRISAAVERLLGEVGAFAQPPDLWKRVEAPQPTWIAAASELTAALMPPAVAERAFSKRRVKIVPAGAAWNAPFEMLTPAGAASPQDCWVGRAEIGYAVSLRHAGFGADDLGPQRPSVVLSQPSFFTADSELDQQLQAELTAAIGEPVPVVLSTAKPMPANFLYPIARAARVYSAAELQLTPDAGAAIATGRQGAVAVDIDEIGLVASPNSWWWFGTDPQTARQMLERPRLLTSWLDLQRRRGGERILLRQWHSRGESTATLARELLQRVGSGSAPAALRQSVMSLWEYRFASDHESRFTLQPGRRGEPRLLEGAMPVFWGGWKLVTFAPLLPDSADVTVAAADPLAR